MEREDRYELEKRVIDGKIGFFIHLAIYVLINIFIIPNWDTNISSMEFLPTVGWGIGVAAHFLKSFIFNEKYVEKLVKRKIDE